MQSIKMGRNLTGFKVEKPITSQYGLLAKMKKHWRDGMGMPASFFMLFFGPGVGVEQGMFGDGNVMLSQQSPQVDAVHTQNNQVTGKIGW